MGEATASICPLCGREAGAATAAVGAVVCACRGPFGFIFSRAEAPKKADKPAEKTFDPGAGIPSGIRDGLIEIHSSIKEKRNPKGGRALCLDVLDQILEYCRQTWPASPKPAKPSAPPIAKDVVIAGATVALSVAAALAVGWKLGLSLAPDEGTCHSCAGSVDGYLGFVFVVLLSAVLGLALSAAIQLGRRSASLLGSHDHHGSAHAPDGPIRLSRIQGLREQGVITLHLFEWAQQIGLDEPPKPKPGEAPPAHPPTPLAPADHDGVRMLGGFVLALADQVYVAPRRLDDARTGRWS